MRWLGFFLLIYFSKISYVDHQSGFYFLWTHYLFVIHGLGEGNRMSKASF